MRARPDGFALKFTRPVDPATAGDPKSYRMLAYTYIYKASYGSPEVDETRPTIDRAAVVGRRHGSPCCPSRSSGRGTSTSCTSTASARPTACRSSTKRPTTR